MQMIDVLKRLAELDAKNPNIVKESFGQPTYKITNVGEFKELGKGKSMASATAYDPNNEEDDGFPVTLVVSKEDMGVGNLPTERNVGDRVEVFDATTKKNITDLVDFESLELDPNYRDRFNPGLNECGMMGGMGAPSTPASINMTAATGEELSAMLKDIMTLAGRPADHNHGPMGEPMGGANGVAVVDMEPSPEVGMRPDVGGDDTAVMRSMIDKLNPSDDDQGDEQDDDDEEQKVSEYDNSPEETVAGYGASVPSGNDLHKEKRQFPAAQPGDNAMAATFESLMAEYKKFISEDHNADRNEIMNDLVRDTAAELGVDLQSPVSYDVAQKIAQKIEAGSSDTPYWNQKQHTADDVLLWMDDVGLIGQDQDMKEGDVVSDERASLEARLKKLEAEFDPYYQYSDDHRVWSHHNRIAQQIQAIKKHLGQSQDIEEASTMESMLKLAGLKK